MSQEIHGHVKFFDVKKGWGFIKLKGGGQEVFVHFSAIQGQKKGERMLKEGQSVRFEIVQGQKGPQAANVWVNQ